MTEQDRKNRFEQQESAFFRDLETPWDVEEFMRQKEQRTPEPERDAESAIWSEMPQRCEKGRGTVATREWLVHRGTNSTSRKELPPRRRTSESARTQRGGMLPRQSRSGGVQQRKVNIRGWAILIGGALAVLLVLIGLILLLVHTFSPSEAKTQPSSESVIATEPQEQMITALLERADRLAAGYDYEGATTVLREFGTNWQEQPKLSEANERYQQLQSAAVKVENVKDTPLLSFKSLIVDAARAFDDDEDAKTYNQCMVTVAEFNSILQSLYDKGYVLVRMHDLYQTVVNQEGKSVYAEGEIYLPAGKKPLILIQDDVNYYASMTDGDSDGVADAKGDGFASRLVVQEDGSVVSEYIAADGSTVYGAYDLVPVLEAFVQEHPDFSYRGAHGVLSLTGTEGVFGYHTHPDWKKTLGDEAYSQEVLAAQQTAQALKQNGWEIANHTYGHISYGDSNQETVASDVQKWKNQVQPIVGETDLLLYPAKGGLYEYSGGVFDTLYEAGYRLFCNTDTKQGELRFFDTYLRISRKAVGGYWMSNEASIYQDFFDAQRLLDSSRPTPIPAIS